MLFLVLPPKVRPRGSSFQLNALYSVQCLNLLALLVCLLLSGIIQLLLKFLFVPTATFTLSPSQNEARSALPTMLVSHGFQHLLFPLPWARVQVCSVEAGGGKEEKSLACCRQCREQSCVPQELEERRGRHYNP